MKKVVSLLLVAVLACSCCVTALATEPNDATTVNSTGSVGTDYVAGDNGLTHEGKDTNYGEGNDKVSTSQTVEQGKLDEVEDVDVYVSKGPTYTVMIPKVIVLNGTDGTGAYTVSVAGDIEGEMKITVTPDAEVTLKQAGKADIKAAITQAKKDFTEDELTAAIADADNAENLVTADGSIAIATGYELTAGSWAGTFHMHISYDANPQTPVGG